VHLAVSSAPTPVTAREHNETKEDTNEVATKTATATEKDESVGACASLAPTPVAASERNQTEEDTKEVATKTATATNKDECVQMGTSLPVAVGMSTTGGASF